MKINVMPGTSQLGQKTIEQLLAQGVPPQDVIASTRRPAALSHYTEQGVAVRHADYDQPKTLQWAFADTDTLILIPPSTPLEQRVQQHHNALEAVREMGIKKIIFSSIVAVSLDTAFAIAPFLTYAELKTRHSGIDWTILRNNLYLDPIADWMPELVKMGRLPYPVKHGKIAYASREDMARGTAAAAIQPDTTGQVYELAAAQAYNMEHVAAAVSEATGEAVVFDSISEAEFIENCRADNIPEYGTRILASIYRAADQGHFDTPSNDLERLTGKPAEEITSFLKHYWNERATNAV